MNLVWTMPTTVKDRLPRMDGKGQLPDPGTAAPFPARMASASSRWLGSGSVSSGVSVGSLATVMRYLMGTASISRLFHSEAVWGDPMTDYTDIAVTQDGHVTTVEIQRPPANFFDHSLIGQIADAFDAADEDPNCRAIVLASEGKHFCAGANFGSGQSDDSGSRDFTEEGFRNTTGKLYREAARLFANKTPIVGAIQGAAIGGGLGLALVPDFRVAAPEARFGGQLREARHSPGIRSLGHAAAADRRTGSGHDAAHRSAGSARKRRWHWAWSTC